MWDTELSNSAKTKATMFGKVKYFAVAMLASN